MDLVEFLNSCRDAAVVPVGGLHRSFFDWDDENKSDYLTNLFQAAKQAGRWVFMDPSGIPESVSKGEYESLMDQICQLRKL